MNRSSMEKKVDLSKNKWVISVGIISLMLAGGSFAAFLSGATLDAIYLVLMSTVLWHEMNSNEITEKEEK